MPNTKSAKKRLRQNVTRKDLNLSVKRALRTQIRKVRDAIGAENVELAETEFRLVTKKLDRAATEHIIHANAAARLKSRLSAHIKKLKQA